MMKMLKKNKGFTLIEIIVVIVILAVLMAVAVPSVMSYINEGQNARYQTVGRSVLINAQAEYAKAVAAGENDPKATATTNVTGKHNYGNATVSDVKITLTKDADTSVAASDKDVDKVEATIKIGNEDKGKQVTVDANKKVTVEPVPGK